MQPGLSGQIEFLGPDCVHRQAAITPTDVTLSGPQAIEVRWLVGQGSGPSTEVERICYLAHDRTIWWARVRCHGMQDGNVRKVEVWLEHQRETGGHIRMARDLKFLDWEGNKWTATIQSVSEPFPAAPKFVLRPL